MSFRIRVFLAQAAVLVPLAVFAWGVRGEVARRLTAQYEQHVTAMAEVLEKDLAAQGSRIGGRLRSLAESLPNDDRFRLAVQGSEAERPYLLDYATHAMELTGLSMLQIQDESGRILSSGHFRNEYDRLEPELPRRLASVPGGPALVLARTATGPLLVLAQTDSVGIGQRVLDIVGGVAVEPQFLSRLERDPGLTVSLEYPGGVLKSDAAFSPEPARAPAVATGSDSLTTGTERVVQTIALPFLSMGPHREVTVQSARILLTQSLAELAALRHQLDVWFVLVAGTTLLLALLMAAALAARIGRPLADLARKTAEVDLEKLDVDFATDRKDEIGALSRLLGAMTERLQRSARRLRDAERRATFGDLARQVNHDIKNGLVPIRNVLRHLAQVAERDPQRLADVLHDRQPTLDGGIAYLEKLAANYARLTPTTETRPCDVNAAAREVTREPRGPGVEFRLRLASDAPRALSDPVALRRVLENLIANAVESLEAGRGTVTVATAAVDSGVRIVVSDTGRGMDAGEAERAFDDFYTTKADGTGLGLSIVRRLVRDAGGDVQVETSPGAGSRFIVDLPAAGGAVWPARVPADAERRRRE